jgi:hypothetical protein
MPFYIRVISPITPVHCITQTEEPFILIIDRMPLDIDPKTGQKSFCPKYI